MIASWCWMNYNKWVWYPLFYKLVVILLVEKSLLGVYVFNRYTLVFYFFFFKYIYMHSKVPQWGHSLNKGPRMIGWYMISAPHLGDVFTHGQHEEKVIMHLNISKSWGEGLFVLRVNPSKLKDIMYLYEHKISPFLKEYMLPHQEIGITPLLCS